MIFRDPVTVTIYFFIFFLSFLLLSSLQHPLETSEARVTSVTKALFYGSLYL